MLPRDIPSRTTFYDPVAERQMSQTDAKLFYQRSQAEARSASGVLSSTPGESPLIAPGSRPTTEYGADSLVLETEEPQSEVQMPLRPQPEAQSPIATKSVADGALGECPFDFAHPAIALTLLQLPMRPMEPPTMEGQVWPALVS